MSAGLEVVELDASQVDRVEPLFKQLVDFHREAVKGAWPVRSVDAAWAHRRAEYVEWLGGGTARMLVAVPAGAGDAPPRGYATLSIKPSSASWDVGERIGELETLAVAQEARGEGIGSLLIESCRALLREEGVSHWSVGVVEVNEGATRLYERVGFRPFYRQLLAEV
jgi:GNAT superfamily N-acetyltransferase